MSEYADRSAFTIEGPPVISREGIRNSRRTLCPGRETTRRLARFAIMPRKHDPDIFDWLGSTDEQTSPATERTLRSLEWVCTECRVVFYSDMPIVPPPECDFCGCCYFETEKAE